MKRNHPLQYRTKLLQRMIDVTDIPYRFDFFSFPFAFGRPTATARVRQFAEDFMVEEQLGFDPSGEGPHWLLHVEKRGANTPWVARELAKLGKAKLRDVGYSGMKDRHAVTRQWFSLPRQSHAVDWLNVQHPEFRILQATPHNRKLKRGTHRSNRFRLVLRNVTDAASLPERIRQISEHGVPDYFGPQRFGRFGDNVAAALSGRNDGIHISALRSHLFNAVLAERVQQDTWDKPLRGDAFQLSGSHSFFRDDGSEQIANRVASGDIHPTGPLWGEGDSPVTADTLQLENEVLSRFPDIVAALGRFRLRQERKSLRLCPVELALDSTDESNAIVCFELPAGSFATSVLREICIFAEGVDDDRQD